MLQGEGLSAEWFLRAIENDEARQKVLQPKDFYHLKCGQCFTSISWNVCEIITPSYLPIASSVREMAGDFEGIAA